MRKTHASILKIARLGMFLAFGVILNFAESYIALPMIAPGVKLGLANTVGLIVLYYFGEKEFVAVGFLRIILTALFTGFGYNFFISLAGWFLSSLLVVLLSQFKKLSIFGLSMVSAVAHGLGQIIMVSILYESRYMINYLPILAFSGIVTGLAIAFVAREALKRIVINE
jgi:heptaprenyl diphosphate synthase